MKKALVAGVTFLAPLMASAQLQNLQNNIITPAGTIIKALIPMVFALAMLFFFWGLATYILGADHDKDVAKKRMIWGVVALFVMSSVWGLVTFLGTSIGIGQDTAPTVNKLIPQN